MTSRALVRALARAGLEPGGPLGAGAGGPRWAARDAAGRGWAVTVVPADDVGRADLRRRVAALAGLDHPHVARVAPLLELRDGTAAVLQAEVAGPDLGTVCAARGPWTPGEVATLVVPLAEGLAALHDVGVPHGDVAPGNVVLEPDGRAVLVDLACGASGAEAGTPGLAAPERLQGATPAGDVHALARLALALLDDGAATGSAAVHAPDRGALAAVLRTATDADPGRRPSASRLAAQVYAACPPEPVRMPDAAVLARLTLRRLAEPPDDATVRLARRAAGAPARGRHRCPRGGGPSRRPAGVAVVLLVGLAMAGVVAAAGRAGDPAGVAPLGAAASSTVAPRRAVGAVDPVTAAVRLTRERTRALAERDRPALAAVTVPGSAAAAADALVARAVWRRTPTDGGVDVRGARLLDLAAPAPGSPAAARVLVTARAWVRTGGAGPAGAAGPVGVVLVLERRADGWRVSAVEPSPG